MTKTQKGVQGFIKLPKELKKTKRGVFYLSDNQMMALKEHCNQIGLTPSEFVRERLKDIIKD